MGVGGLGRGVVLLRSLVFCLFGTSLLWRVVGVEVGIVGEIVLVGCRSEMVGGMCRRLVVLHREGVEGLRCRVL